MVHVITARNAAEALPIAIDLLLREGVRESSRNGDVLVMSTPVVTVLTRPWEKVILSPVRDANPFLHLCESVWMLAGRDDVDSLTPYVKGFARYAEFNGIVHGAYGYRWRRWFGYDQLSAAVDKLRADPGTRQAVIGMWDATDRTDVGIGADDLKGTYNDRPCNLNLLLRLNPRPGGMPHDDRVVDAAPVLDMTVTNRSHDVLWGLLGANAVHFAVLQENLATQLDVGMGNLMFFSNNFHVYRNILDKLLPDHGTFREIRSPEEWALLLLRTPPVHPLASEPYGDSSGNLRTVPLYNNALQAAQDDELKLLWSLLDQIHDGEFILSDALRTPFYIDVFYAASAHRDYRAGEWKTALFHAGLITAPDWRMACLGWLERRRARAEEKAK